MDLTNRVVFAFSNNDSLFKLLLALTLYFGSGLENGNEKWKGFTKRKLLGKKNKRLNITILTIGTRGDVQPFIAFGQELIARGNSAMRGWKKLNKKIFLGAAHRTFQK